MGDKAFSGFLYNLYRAWCRERELDPKDDANKRVFLDQALPTEGTE